MGPIPGAHSRYTSGMLARALAALLALSAASAAVGAPDGMVWVPPGDFSMGSVRSDAWPSEGPVHTVRVDGFWMDATEVTNAQFARFVEATGYLTVAERPISWEELKAQLPPDTPKPPDEMLLPGSLVFVPPGPDATDEDLTVWWKWTPGADWRHPEGPGSTIEGRMDHPVVQVAWEDAVAYAKWAGKRLPTEAEWERAARGGVEGAHFVWGEDAPSDAKPQSNIWQGVFPASNTLADGFLRTAPVKSFPANGYGLYDMAGNVWEWCDDWYVYDQYRRRTARLAPGAVVENPPGPDEPWDPNEPFAKKRVIRGGSFLCNASYCSSYRPSARLGGAYDTGTSHTGFRCVMPGDPPQEAEAP